jgi:hypothetical protein
MTLERKITWLFAANALINWTLSIRGIVDPAGMAAMFGAAPPNYPFVIRLWQGFVFMFGCMFWEVSRDPRRKAALIKYNWIEKTITALAITGGYVAGEVPTALMALIVATNWAWIPFLLYYDMALRAALRRPGVPIAPEARIGAGPGVGRAAEPRGIGA